MSLAATYSTHNWIKKGREGVLSMHCCKVWKGEVLITGRALPSSPTPFLWLSLPNLGSPLSSQTVSCLRLGVLCFRFISFPYLCRGCVQEPRPKPANLSPQS